MMKYILIMGFIYRPLITAKLMIFRFLITFVFLVPSVVLYAADGLVLREFKSAQKFDELYAAEITSSVSL